MDNKENIKRLVVAIGTLLDEDYDPVQIVGLADRVADLALEDAFGGRTETAPAAIAVGQ